MDEYLPSYAKLLKKWFLEVEESPSSTHQEDSNGKD